jgi:hypothetical protein
MTKKLSSRIAERIAIKKSSRSAMYRATFLVLRDDIVQALDDGWSIKTIWETLHEEGKINFTYQSFLTYVKRVILAPKPVAANIETAKPPLPKPPEPTKPMQLMAPGVRGFTFQATPNKEDLI